MAEQPGAYDMRYAQDPYSYRGASPLNELFSIIMKKALGDPVVEADRQAKYVANAYEMYREGIDPFKNGVDPKYLEKAGGTEIASLLRGAVASDQFKEQQKQRQFMDQLSAQARETSQGQVFEFFTQAAGAAGPAPAPIRPGTQFAEAIQPALLGGTGYRGPTNEEVLKKYKEMSPLEQGLSTNYKRDITGPDLMNATIAERNQVINTDQVNEMKRKQDWEEGLGGQYARRDTFLTSGPTNTLIQGGLDPNELLGAAEVYGQGKQPKVTGTYINPTGGGRGKASKAELSPQDRLALNTAMNNSKKDQLELYATYDVANNPAHFPAAQAAMINQAVRTAMTVTLVEEQDRRAVGRPPTSIERLKAEAWARAAELVVIQDPKGDKGIMGDDPSWVGLGALPEGHPVRDSVEGQMAEALELAASSNFDDLIEDARIYAARAAPAAAIGGGGVPADTGGSSVGIERTGESVVGGQWGNSGGAGPVVSLGQPQPLPTAAPAQSKEGMKFPHLALAGKPPPGAVLRPGRALPDVPLDKPPLTFVERQKMLQEIVDKYSQSEDPEEKAMFINARKELQQNRADYLKGKRSRSETEVRRAKRHQVTIPAKQKKAFGINARKALESKK